MELLNELEQKSKTIELELFLEDLREMGADLGNIEVSEIVYERIDQLVEMGRGDYDAFSSFAKQAGVDPRAAKPGVAGALENPRLGLGKKVRDGQPTPMPKRDQKVSFRSKFGKALYTVVDTAGDTVILQDPRGERYNIRAGHLKALRDDQQQIVGWSALTQPAPYQAESLMQQVSQK